MNRHIRQLICSSLFCATLSCLVYALPGIQSLLPDESGQYVVYRDYTFIQETYLGFLCYNEAQYGAFLLTPDTEKRIALLFTLNTEVPYADIIGERIISDITPKDTDAINYIHDMIYELSARRAKVNGHNFNDTVRTQTDFPQFGGSVTEVYDFYIPLFNLRLITDAHQKKSLELVRMGQLSSAEDPSFFEFSLLPSPFLPEVFSFSVDTGLKNDSTSTQAIEVFGQKLMLDSQWTQPIEDIWLLSEVALFEIALLSSDSLFTAQHGYTEIDYFTRFFSLSSYNKWGLVPSFQLVKKTDSTRLENVFYDADTNALLRLIRVFIPNVYIDGTSYTVLKLLSVYESVYQSNKAYFDGIIQ